jgi:hypothetical protein
LVSHPDAFIDSACWVDSNGDKYLSLSEENKANGSLKNTIGLLNVDMSGCIFNNAKTFEDSSINVTIKLAGGL